MGGSAGAARLTAAARPVRPGAVLLLTALALAFALAFFPDYWDWDLHRLREVIRLDLQRQVVMAYAVDANAVQDRMAEERARARAEARVKARVTGSMRDLFGRFVTDLVLQPDGKVVAVGYQPGLGVARFERDGSLDREFVRRASWEFAGDLGGVARRVEVAPDGGIIVHGTLTFRSAPHVRIRFHPDGSLDTRFLSTGESRTADAESPVPVWVAGVVAELARPPAAPSPGPKDPWPFICGNDPAFWPPHVQFLALQPDGRALILRTKHGSFGLIRASQDGQREEVEIPRVCAGMEDGTVRIKSLAFQSEGGILMTGDLPVWPRGARTCQHAVLWRIAPGFSLDEAFPMMWWTEVEGAAYGRAIDALVVLGDGRIVVGGEFTSLRGEKRRNIAVLRGDGSVDES